MSDETESDENSKNTPPLPPKSPILTQRLKTRGFSLGKFSLPSILKSKKEASSPEIENNEKIAKSPISNDPISPLTLCKEDNLGGVEDYEKFEDAEDNFEKIGDFVDNFEYEEVLFSSPCVHHNVTTSEIKIPDILENSSNFTQSASHQEFTYDYPSLTSEIIDCLNKSISDRNELKIRDKKILEKDPETNPKIDRDTALKNENTKENKDKLAQESELEINKNLTDINNDDLEKYKSDSNELITKEGKSFLAKNEDKVNFGGKNLSKIHAKSLDSQIDEKSQPKKLSSNLSLETHDKISKTRPPVVGGENYENFDNSEIFENNYENSVVVSKFQEMIILAPNTPPSVSYVQNPSPNNLSCVKYKVVQSPSGITTISIDPKSEVVNLTTPQPVIHHVINLPPRRIDLIKNRRRKTEDFSYKKSYRLSQLLEADFRTNWNEGSNNKISKGSNNVHLSKSKTDLISSNTKQIRENMGSMGRNVRRKMGAWYRRKLKTPVEQLSIDLGLDGLKLPKSLSKTPHPSTPPPTFGNFKRAKSQGVDSAVFSFDISDDVDGETDLGDGKSLEDLATEQGQNEFEELRRVVKQGGDFCKDLSAVLQERSELEAQYAKGLSKLSAKLLKASKEATGSVAHAWQAVAVQIDTQAELHRIWSTALLDEVAKPLRNSTETQHKIRKSVEVLVEKTTRNLAEWRTAEAKAKRQCFSSSKEFEKIQENSCGSNSPTVANSLISTTPNPTSVSSNQNISTNNIANSVLAEVRARSRILSVPPPDKDPIKLEAKRRKAEEAVRRADVEYYTFCVRSERARLEWEGAIRNGSTCLRTLEEEKLALLQELASKYYQHLNEFIPKLVLSSECLEEPIKRSSVEQDMHGIVDMRRHAGSEQLLPDFYAEDISNLMNKERRREALHKFLYIIKQDLDRERKGAVGIENLAKAITEAPRVLDAAHHDISDKLYYVKSMFLYLEGSRVKIENAIADTEGRGRGNKTITQYMRHQRDKQGLPQTILKVPTWARDECLANTNSDGVSSESPNSGSLSPDWRDKDRGNADGNSNSKDEADFDEFSSEGSEHVGEEVFDEDNLVSKDLIVEATNECIASIGKCRVIYDYDSNMFDELTIRTGEVLNVHDKQEDGWWLGELNGQVGIFPATYVEEIKEES